MCPSPAWGVCALLRVSLTSSVCVCARAPPSPPTHHLPLKAVVLADTLVRCLHNQAFVCERFQSLTCGAVVGAATLTACAAASVVTRAPLLHWGVRLLARTLASALVWRALSRHVGLSTAVSLFAGVYGSIVSVVLLLLRLRWNTRDNLFEASP